MDKKHFEVTTLDQGDDHDYWKNKSYLERMEALEELRMRVFGYDPSTARLQRIFTVTQLKKH